MAIRQARLNKLGLSALATRERSRDEWRRVERNKLCNRSVPRLAQQLRGGQAGPMRHDRAIQVVQHRTFL